MNRHIIILKIFAILSLINGGWMFFHSWSWYHYIPFDIWNIGPYNGHFIRDIGAVYMVQGFGLYWCAKNLKKCRSVLLFISGFIILHAILHIIDLLSLRIPDNHWWLDFSVVFLPGIYFSILLIPDIWHKIENNNSSPKKENAYVAIFCLLFSIIVAIYLYYAVFHYKTMQNNISWHHNYQKAKSIAQEKKLPMLVKIEAPVCINCDRLDALTFSEDEIVKFNAQFIFVKINRITNIDLCHALKITRCPSILFFSSEGKELKRLTGFQSKEELFLEIQHFLSRE